MFNKTKSKLKAFAWMTFVHVDLQKNTTTKHSNKLMQLFDKILLPYK